MKRLILLVVLCIALILAAGCDGQEKKCLADGGYYVPSSTGDCYQGKMCTCDNGAWENCRVSDSCSTTTPQALPDLKILEVRFENDQLFATVRNDGPEPAQYIGVACDMDCTEDLTKRPRFQFNDRIQTLDAGSERTVTSRFTIKCEDFGYGYHSRIPNGIRLKCEVDYLNIVQESDDRNNFFYIDVYP